MGGLGLGLWFGLACGACRGGHPKMFGNSARHIVWFEVLISKMCLTTALLVETDLRKHFLSSTMGQGPDDDFK
ncbi:hypothetical protein BDZ94DRAFT_1273217 [Collybia nuda]|uniref:Secreted protein n=1 Tax=Collybia nuda TaxID=64659 RepID=A0A9P5XUT4_9AGAR|nr:hypothetical protein BDZ94DRAFT_1273217 [Collybia nuda]